MIKNTFYFITLGFLGGVALASLYDFSDYVIYFLIFIFTCLCVYLSISNIKGHHLALCLIGISFCIGLLRMDFTKQERYTFDHLLGTTVTVDGSVCDDPRVKDLTQSFCFSVSNTSEKILVQVNTYPTYHYGDRLEITGVLTLPKNFSSYEGGPLFDYVSYLAKDGIRYKMFHPQISVLSKEETSIQKILFSIKNNLIDRIGQLIPEPESSLLGGILLGDKQGLSKEMTDRFRDSGLIHILVLSGYNIALIGTSLMRASAFLPRIYGYVFGFISIILFTVMTGASETAVRASIMALIALGGRINSRPYDVTRALVCAGVCMVLYNPHILVFDISFQLSFLSTLAIIYVAPYVSSKLEFVTERYALRDMISTTIATQIFVAPFIVYSMGQISLVSLISNIVVLPVIPYAMFFGFVSIVLGYIHTFIALPVAWFTTYILSYVVHMASLFGDLPFASIHIQTSLFWLVCIYAFYVFILIRFWRQKNSLEHSAS